MDAIESHLRQVEEGMTLLDTEEINRVVRVLKVVKDVGGTVYLFGNGGSHTTAAHFANDLSKMLRIKAECLGNMTALVTAYGNDTGWRNMYSGILAHRVKERDCVVGISCGGNSENVLFGLRLGRERECFSIGLTGMDNSSEINKLGLDALVHTPGVPDIRVQEDLHLMVCHAIVRQMQEER